VNKGRMPLSGHGDLQFGAAWAHLTRTFDGKAIDATRRRRALVLEVKDRKSKLFSTLKPAPMAAKRMLRTMAED